MPDATARNADPRIAGRRFYLALAGVAGALPATTALLFFLHRVPIRPTQPDIDGVVAVSAGILGIVFFFRSLYRLQRARPGVRQRLGIMLLHAAMLLLLFFGLIHVGFDAPWTAAPVWGSYGLADACRSWIIAVLVAGTLTLVAGIMDLVRERYLS